jgi:uncharacterized protein YkwD
MKVKFIGVLLIFSIVYLMISCTPDTSGTLNGSTASTQKTVVYTYNSNELEVMTLINNYRVSVGLNKLEQINYISHKSEEHDNYMIANNVVNHDGFSIRSQNIIDVLGAKAVGENIAYNFDTSQSVLNAWLNSPAHKENIEGSFTHFGISIRIDPISGKKYYTNIFAKI